MRAITAGRAVHYVEIFIRSAAYVCSLYKKRTPREIFTARACEKHEAGRRAAPRRAANYTFTPRNNRVRAPYERYSKSLPGLLCAFYEIMSTPSQSQVNARDYGDPFSFLYDCRAQKWHGRAMLRASLKNPPAGRSKYKACTCNDAITSPRP